MEEIFKSKYATVDSADKIIVLYNTKPERSSGVTELENVTITFEEKSIARIVGSRVRWGFTFRFLFSDEWKEAPEARYTRIGYKNIWDWIRRIKKPYVLTGWYVLKKRAPYQAIMSQWQIIYNSEIVPE